MMVLKLDYFPVLVRFTQKQAGWNEHTCACMVCASPRRRIEDVQRVPLRQCHVEGGSGAFDQKSLNGAFA
jgi:hypothetical protein